ncbi:phosphoadenosine phosphosulfate reductase family protein [Dysgonomonas sp. 25]|uniref:phosphoadenosine phosphosulfate reductase domain-containing protein n=1 Tax=Dysgonomonas sp. 25 TaxID=2302933 RepID=UPI00351B254A
MIASKRFCASISFGKDSLCMLFMLIEKGYPLDEVVFYNTGMDFEAIYSTRDRLIPFFKERGIKFTELHPDKPFLWLMLEKPIRSRDTGLIHKYGYSWCGGPCRWGTGEKLRALKKHIGHNWDYVGIAADETHRFGKETRANRILPLVEWGISEAEALQYCYNKGFFWEENGIRLYDILDRVSCWCCGNKNLKELFNIYRYLPTYWQQLKELQSKTNRPYRRQSGKSLFDLEEEFRKSIKEDSMIKKSAIFV